jgi:hypothetical protein
VPEAVRTVGIGELTVDEPTSRSGHAGAALSCATCAPASASKRRRERSQDRVTKAGQAR